MPCFQVTLKKKWLMLDLPLQTVILYQRSVLSTYAPPPPEKSHLQACLTIPILAKEYKVITRPRYLSSDTCLGYNLI